MASATASEAAFRHFPQDVAESAAPDRAASETARSEPGIGAFGLVTLLLLQHAPQAAPVEHAVEKIGDHQRDEVAVAEDGARPVESAALEIGPHRFDFAKPAVALLDGLLQALK